MTQGSDWPKRSRRPIYRRVVICPKGAPWSAWPASRERFWLSCPAASVQTAFAATPCVNGWPRLYFAYNKHHGRSILHHARQQG